MKHRNLITNLITYLVICPLLGLLCGAVFFWMMTMRDRWDLQYEECSQQLQNTTKQLHRCQGLYRESDEMLDKCFNDFTTICNPNLYPRATGRFGKHVVDIWHERCWFWNLEEEYDGPNTIPEKN